MKRLPYITFACMAGLALAGCTDTQRSKYGALGSSGHVLCYSGGRLVVDDYSTGVVHNAEQSDGYDFKSTTTGRLRRVSGDCQIDYGAPKDPNWKPV